MLKIEFSRHAREKIRILGRHGIVISEEAVREVLLSPEETLPGIGGSFIAQKAINERHVLRVVYRREENQIRVVTLYPARRRRY